MVNSVQSNYGYSSSRLIENSEVPQGQSRCNRKVVVTVATLVLEALWAGLWFSQSSPASAALANRSVASIPQTSPPSSEFQCPSSDRPLLPANVCLSDNGQLQTTLPSQLTATPSSVPQWMETIGSTIAMPDQSFSAPPPCKKLREGIVAHCEKPCGNKSLENATAHYCCHNEEGEPYLKFINLGADGAVKKSQWRKCGLDDQGNPTNHTHIADCSADTMTEFNITMAEYCARLYDNAAVYVRWFV